MIVSKAPLRITFFGGGTDFYSFFKKQKTRTFSAAINKYSYIFIKELSSVDSCRFRIGYSRKEQVKSYKDLDHPVFKAALNLTNLKNSRLEINYFSDLPSFSGTGSSSAFVVALLNGLHFYKGKKISKKELADQAIYLERKYLKEPGGYQDQLTCSYGGICLFQYFRKKINKIKITNKSIIQSFINENFMLVFTGVTRDGTKVINKQINQDNNREVKLNSFSSQADESLNLIRKGSLKDFGELLNKSWLLKKKMPGVSSKNLDKIYKKTLQAGSLGGKLLGAGGGGFFLCLVPKNKKIFFNDNLSDFKTIDVKVSDNGSEVNYIKF